MNRMALPPRVTIIVLGVAILAGVAAAERPEPTVHGTFDGDPMYTMLPVDGIPAIRAPEFLNGEEADAQMQADEPVLGVEFGGETHAYSLWQLDSHEIVNDTVGGRAIAATW